MVIVCVHVRVLTTLLNDGTLGQKHDLRRRQIRGGCWKLFLSWHIMTVHDHYIKYIYFLEAFTFSSYPAFTFLPVTSALIPSPCHPHVNFRNMFLLLGHGAINMCTQQNSHPARSAAESPTPSKRFLCCSWRQAKAFFAHWHTCCWKPLSNCCHQSLA